MPRQRESNFELLLKLPWWANAAIGVTAYAGLRWGLPFWAGDDKNLQLFTKSFVGIAPAFLVLFGIFAAGSFWFGQHRRRLLDQQSSIESIRTLSWKQFEFLVAEAYQRQGYQVEFSLGRGTDGGVDLTLRRAGRKTLVQCKQWKVYSVGAPVIHAMFGLMAAENADETIIVTSGRFTRDAQEFAVGKPIQLVDGPQLLALIQSVQGQAAARPERPSAPAQVSIPDCPACSKPMVLRTSKRGANAGNQFWGCTTFPACKGTRNLATARG